MSTSESNAVPHKRLPWIIGGSALAVVIIIVLSFYATNQGVISDGNQKEATLSAQYLKGATYLSNCVVKTKQSVGLANSESAKLDKILADAVAGRYNNGGAQVDNGKLFSAIQEAYPDLSGLTNTFNLVLATINGCQDDYRNQQTLILSDVADFRSWRTGSWTVRNLGGGSFPNENLYINIPGVSVTGQAALDKMSQPIVDTTTDQTYQDGTFSATDPFAGNGNG